MAHFLQKTNIFAKNEITILICLQSTKYLVILFQLYLNFNDIPNKQCPIQTLKKTVHPSETFRLSYGESACPASLKLMTKQNQNRPVKGVKHNSCMLVLRKICQFHKSLPMYTFLRDNNKKNIYRTYFFTVNQSNKLMSHFHLLLSFLGDLLFVGDDFLRFSFS